MRYLVDTTFIIDHLRADRAAVERLDRMLSDGDEPFVNEVVACEAWSGSAVGDGDLETLLHALEFIQPGPEAAKLAGRWRSDARAGGWALSLSDALIAAAAHWADAVVVTRNVRDFALTPVRIETY